MSEGFGKERDLSMLVVPRVGAVRATEDRWEPVRLIGAAGDAVPFGRGLPEGAAGVGALDFDTAVIRDGHLLRWFRFRLGVEVPWDQATRLEARDFCRCSR